MPKFKVGDKFKVVDSNSFSEELQNGEIHVLTKVLPLTSADTTQFYTSEEASWQWYLEETEVHNQLIVVGIDKILAVLNKIEKPDT